MPIKKVRRALKQFWSGGEKRQLQPIFETLEDRWLMSANSQVSGTVYADLNNDGARQTSEVGLAGVQIALQGITATGGTVSLTTTTDANGGYLFDSLADGTYTVSETLTPDYFPGKPSTGSLGGSAAGNGIANIVLSNDAKAQGYDFAQLPPGRLTGCVYVDSNSNNAFDSGEGMAGEAVVLTGTDDQGVAVNRMAQTDMNGKYTFASLRPGSYTITKSDSTLGLMDAGSQVGTQGGAASSSQINSISLAPGTDGKDNNFKESSYSMISGAVYLDYNLNGIRDIGELGISGVSITLSGVDDRGAAVSQTVVTSGGSYQFLNLRPGNYTLTEAQPQDYADGKASAGTAGGTVDVNTIKLSLGAGVTANKYNFSEVNFTPLGLGQTATASWWSGSRGQALIKAVNGAATATALGNWLATTLPNLFGSASSHPTAGKTNTLVASLMVTLNKSATSALEANVMALALSEYVTSSTLAGTAATRYGFAVTAAGCGDCTYVLYTNGAALGIANGMKLSVKQVLAAANAKSAKGVAWALDTAANKAAAKTVLVAINAIGKIK